MVSDQLTDWELTPQFAWGSEIRRGCFIGLIVVVILCLFQARDPGFELVDDDTIASWQPVFTDFARQLRSGHMPVWSHHTQCGYPLLGWPQPTFVYPVHWLSHLVCSLLGLDAREMFVTTLLHYFLAAAGTFVLLRRFDVVPGAAATASLGYALSGILLGLGACWANYVFTASYWPLVLLALEELRAGNAPRFWTPFLGLLGGLAFLSNDLSVMIKFAFFPGLYFLLRMRRPMLEANLKQLAIASALALVIGIGQSFPSAEIILGSYRMGQGSTDVYITPPNLWLGLIFPFNLLPWERGAWRAGGGNFVGPCAVLGALFVARSFLRVRGPQRALLILTVVYVGLALGQHWYPSVALQGLPFFSSFRWPFRWMLEGSAALALLSGFGLHLAWEQLRQGQGRGTLLAFLALTGFVLLMRYPSPAGLEMLTPTMMFVWAGGLAGLWLCSQPETSVAFPRLVCAWSFLALVANVPVAQQTLLARMTQLVNNPIPIEQDPQERVLFLSRHDELVPCQEQGSLALSFPHQFQTRAVLGYVYRPAGQSWMEGVDANGLLYGDKEEKEAIRRFLAPPSTLLATLRVGHVVIRKTNKLLLEACEGRPDLRLESETAFFRIYRNLGFKEPAFFVRVLTPEKSRTDIEELGTRAQLPRAALVEPGYSGPTTFTGTGTVRDFREDHGRLSMRADCKDEGFLVITTTYFPRWRATIDGKEAPVLRANGSFLALRVPPGQHEIELAYWPTDHLLLLAVSALALLVVGAYCARQAVCKTRKRNAIQLAKGEAEKINHGFHG